MDKGRFLALFLVAIMMPLSGCISDGVDGEQGEQGPQGPPGTNGIDGIDGIDGNHGVNGTDGQNGNDGQDGIDGQNAMISTFDVLPGIHCENGGIGLLVGVDENGNGMLTSNEVQETTFVCNGVDGSHDTTSGTSSSGLLSAVATLGFSDGCPAGGKVMMFGLDNGDNDGTANNGVLESGEIDEQTTYCSTQRISRVTDIAPGALFSNPGGDGMQIVVRDTLYFSANDGIHGAELWAYDMTTDSTRIVADINPGQNASFPGYWLVLVHEDVIYFDAADPSHGRELWAHNTVNGSTWLVANINDDEFSSNPGDDIEIVYGDTLYFSAFTFQYGTELWAHHPANNSTWLVEDIHHGSSANPGWLMHFVYNDVLYFTARDMMNVHDLWAHNKTNGSTWKVASFGMAPWTHPGENFEFLIGDVLYFDADNELNGRELMAYNLKTDTHWVVTDIVPGMTASNPGANMSILVDDTIYFDTDERFLYAHSTSNHTTWMVHQFTDASPQDSVKPVAIGSEFFYKIEEEGSHLELWAYNTKNHSTWMMKRFIPPTSTGTLDIGIIENVNGILYVDATTGVFGRELWAYNPMDQSIWQVANINKANAGTDGPDGNSMPGFSLSLVHNGYFFFSATDGAYGNELWKMWFEHTITYE